MTCDCSCVPEPPCCSIKIIGVCALDQLFLHVLPLACNFFFFGCSWWLVWARGCSWQFLSIAWCCSAAGCTRFVAYAPIPFSHPLIPPWRACCFQLFKLLEQVFLSFTVVVLWLVSVLKVVFFLLHKKALVTIKILVNRFVAWPQLFQWLCYS